MRRRRSGSCLASFFIVRRERGGHSSPVTPVERSYFLVERGDVRAGFRELERSADAGDAASLLELGIWYLEGRYVPRDLAQSREQFRRAGQLGDVTAEHALICFLANGIGGNADWSAAEKRLRRLAQRDAQATLQLELLASMDIDGGGFPRVRPVSHQLSTIPQVWTFNSFASARECDYLIRTAEPRLRESVVVDPATGQLRPHPVRTSDGATFPWVSADMVITALNRRIAAASATDDACGEPLQVLRYRPGQEYRPHLDALPEGGNQRVLTMLVYLNDDYQCGETFFIKTGLKVAATTGAGLLFCNALPGGLPDPFAEHAGLPVVSGQKFIASRWIRERAIVAD